MMNSFELASGGNVEVLDTNGDNVVLRSDAAFPPGSTCRFRGPVPNDGGEPACGFEVKVRSCQRAAEQAGFRVEGRFVNLSRGARERLLAARSAQGGPDQRPQR